MKKLFFLLLSLLVLPVLANAATIYVDADCGNITTYVAATGACTGGSARSFTTINGAFDYSGLTGDDHIQIRSGTYNETATMVSKSGTSGHQIVIEPYPSETPVIRYSGNGADVGAFDFTGCNYITIQNLVFTGTGVPVSAKAIRVLPSSADVQGFLITGNTITDWAGTEGQNYANVAAIRLVNNSAHTFVVKNSTISNNIITGVRLSGISMKAVSGITVTGNTISGTLCGRSVGDGSVNALGILVNGDPSAADSAGGNPTGLVITGNTIHDHQFYGSCGISSSSVSSPQPGSSWAGIWFDQNIDSSTIANNTVYNISQAKTDTSGAPNTTGGFVSEGVFVESRCDNNIIQENILYYSGNYGVKNGSVNKLASGNQYLSNAIFLPNRYGFYLVDGDNVVIKNNAVYGSSIVACMKAESGFVPASAGLGHIIDYNAYYDTSGSHNHVGQWNTSTTQSLATWKTACQAAPGMSTCDSHSLNADPLFTNISVGTEDFHLQPSSTLVNAGQNGVDIGAYPNDTPSPPDGTILVLAPVGNERWLIGESRSITWNTTGTVGNVDILLSPDSGSNYPTTIVSNTASVDGATNSYTWTVTGPVSGTSRIKIQDHATGTLIDESDLDFRIGGVRAIISGD